MCNILVINADQILGASIARLLMAEQDFHMAVFTPLCPSEIIERLKLSGPDVVILANDFVTESVLEQIFEFSEQIAALNIIVIDVDDNHVSLNGSQLLPIKHSTDLVKIVRAKHHNIRKKKKTIRENSRLVHHRGWAKRNHKSRTTPY